MKIVAITASVSLAITEIMTAAADTNVTVTADTNVTVTKFVGNGGLYRGYKKSRAEVNVHYDWWDIAAINKTSEAHYWHSINNFYNDQGSIYVPPSQEPEEATVGTTGDISVSTRKKSKSGKITSVRHTRVLRRTNQGYVCCTRMLVSFTSARDIEKGEPLVIDLRQPYPPRPGKRYANKEFARQCM